MEITPYNQTLICENIVTHIEKVEWRGLEIAKENMPIYKVVATSDKTMYDVGDEIICSNLGAKFVDNDKTLYMMKFENVIGKIK